MTGKEKNPWIGLDSYSEKCSYLFFGRDKEINDLKSVIYNDVQTIVYGPSGTGKSSLLKAGLFPDARANNYLPVYLRLDHKLPIKYHHQAINELKDEINRTNGDIENLIEPINDDYDSLWEYFHCNRFWSEDNYQLIPLIVIDQFEEIFTLQDDKIIISAFFKQIADLTNNTLPNYIEKNLVGKKGIREYIEKTVYRFVLVIREDFLARIEDFSKTIPSLKKNRFGLQVLNEEQAMDVITKPVKQLVTDDVAIEIIKKITNETNFKIDGIPEITVEPAILSLFCRRLYEKKDENKVISKNLVEKFGDNIIKEFYAESISKISKTSAQYLESKLLTESGWRFPVPLEDVYKHNVTKEEIESLDKDRIIHICKRNTVEVIEYTHDVLCNHAKKRRDANELEQQRRNIWKKRFSKVKNIAAILFVLLTILFIIGIFVSLKDNKNNYEQYSKEYIKFSTILIKQNGFLNGLDSLTEDEASHKSLYYKLLKKGKIGPYTKIEARDGYHKLTTNHNIGTLLIDAWDSDDDGANTKAVSKLKTVCKWVFIKNDKNEIERESAFDNYGSLVFSFVYTKKVKSKYSTLAYAKFVDKDGNPFIQRKEEVSSIRITYDDSGNEILYEYFDDEGKPTKNSWNAYKEKKEYYPNGLLKKSASLDKIGKYMTDRAGNTGQILEYNHYRFMTKSVSFGKEGDTVKVNDGYAIGKYEYDSYGNIIKALYFDEEGKPCKVDDSYYGYESKYNEHGKMVERRMLDKDGISLMKREDCLHIPIVKHRFDESGNEISLEYFDDQGGYCNTYGSIAKITKAYDKNKLIEQIKYKYSTEKDALEVNYHNKKWKNEHGKDTLVFLYEYELCNLEAISYNENGKENSRSYYEFIGEYTDIDLNKKDILSFYKNRINNRNYYYEGSNYYHKWEEESETNGDTINLIRSFINTGDSVVLIKEYKKVDDKEIYAKYYDINKRFKSAYSQTFSAEGYNNCISYLGISNKPFRNPEFKYCTVKLKFELDMYGNAISYYGFNEFDEKSYIREFVEYDSISEPVYNVFHRYDLESQKHFDVNGKEIPDMKKFKENLKKLYIVYLKPETTKKGKEKIVDGDILVGYGNWRYNGKNINELFTEYDSLKETNKKITVLRFPENELINIDSPNNNFNIGFDSFYLTDKEINRILKLLGYETN